MSVWQPIENVMQSSAQRSALSRQVEAYAEVCVSRRWFHIIPILKFSSADQAAQPF
jgi:hypothetical protein